MTPSWLTPLRLSTRISVERPRLREVMGATVTQRRSSRTPVRVRTSAGRVIKLVVTMLAEDPSITLGEVSAKFPAEGSLDHSGTAIRGTFGNEGVEGGHEVVREANGDLSRHVRNTSPRDA